MMGFNLDSDRVLYKRLLVVQIVATGVVPLLFLLGGIHAGLSALIGGLIALTAWLIQAVKFFGPYRAQYPAELLRVMKQSEVIKLVVVGTIFALVFKGLEWIRPGPIFTGFIIIYLLPMLANATGLGMRKQS